MPKHAQTTPRGETGSFEPIDQRDALPEAPADEEYPDAFESLEPKPEPPLLFGDVLESAPEQPRGRHGKKGSGDVPPHQRKSRRMRRMLIAVIALLVVLIGALVFFSWLLFNESQSLAIQQVQEQQNSQDVEAIQQEDAKDATTETAKKTEVPQLTALFGMTQEEAMAAVGHGATLSGTKAVNEEGNPVKTRVTVTLTDEPADTRTGTPTVYLDLDEDGKVIVAGYSAATASLGYGSLSFVDAVKNEHIVEKTLAEAGVPVPEGTVALPENKAEYSTYDTDGTTLVKENSSFAGAADINGTVHDWSAVLLYDYRTANASGNLADTVRQIYIYVNA